MFSDPTDITKWLGNMETDLEPLHARMEDDWSLWMGEEYLPDATDFTDKHRTMIRNDARVQADKVGGVLMASTLDFHIPTIFGQEQRAGYFSDVERLLRVALDETNANLRKRLMGTLKSLLVIDAVVSGWVCGLALVEWRKGEVHFDVRRWDPRETYFTIGVDGIYRVAHRRWVAENQLAIQYPTLGLKEDSNTEKEVIDFWEREVIKDKASVYNSILVGNEFAKEPRKPERFSELPVFVIPVPGPVPPTDTGGQRLNVEVWGDSIFASFREVARALNELQSEAHQHILAAIHRGSILAGPGAREIAQSVREFGEDDRLHTTNQEVSPRAFAQVTLPPEFVYLMTSYEAQLQRGGISYTSFGQGASQLSGIAISQLLSQESSVLTPRAEAVAAGYEFILNSWFHQLQALKRPYKGYWKQEDKLRALEITEWGDIPPIEVTFQAQLPGREMQDIATALQLRQHAPGEQPLLSMRSLRENYLHVQDAEAEERRVLVERFSALPFVDLQNGADAARREGLNDLARVLEIMADRQLKQMLGEMGGNGQGPPPSPPQGMVPQRAPLPPPQAMPPGALPMLPEQLAPETQFLGAPGPGAMPPMGSEPQGGDMDILRRLAEMGLVAP